MAEATSSGSEMDLERGRNEPVHEQEDVEKPRHGSDNASDLSSAFSERHMEGPPSLRRADSTSLSIATSRRMERVNTSASNALSYIRSRNPRAQFTHPLAN